MLYLVFDTNALIDHLETFRDFSQDIERLRIDLKIIIPSVVLSELDGCVPLTEIRCGAYL